MYGRKGLVINPITYKPITNGSTPNRLWKKYITPIKQCKYLLNAMNKTVYKYLVEM